MNKSLLTKLFGFPATLIHGDTLVLDRWLWLKRRLPITRNDEHLIDIGCGTGAFTIGAAKRGYHSLGLSWDENNQNIAAERAKLCNADEARFEIQDVRGLDSKSEYLAKYDVVLCLENVEHIIDDRKLFRDMAACLKSGGRLLLTTPYFLNYSITGPDNGPYVKTETGWHVRRGYTISMLNELCDQSGLVLEEISFCSGFLSQKITKIMRVCSKIHPLFGWACILPLRIVPPCVDGMLSKLFNWPSYSICMQAYKPRYSSD
jgi:SAM-dependent methyltransferase